ncbi:hypothetical protein EPUL_001341 [Erysiphe pulchra]|uniref:Uncharacterized protein n=1 Tax=Erysiphe pulchra TaxID=225359 RepID=A0A2S4Q1J7_9PEZI|nr:hypothetical protein EPUL_001341 [Erysiphe pulchra]
MLSYTNEALRKAEAIEKILESQSPADDKIESMAGKTSMSAINLSKESEFVYLNEKAEIMASLGVKENFRLASNDLDHPGPNEKLFDEPLCCDDSPRLEGRLKMS